jgi:hypothetical protein
MDWYPGEHELITVKYFSEPTSAMLVTDAMQEKFIRLAALRHDIGKFWQVLR